MSADDRIRERLLTLRGELEQVAQTTDAAAGVVELDQSKVGRLSRMDAMQSQAVAQAIVRRREAMLENISAALQRIDDGIYGFCQSCEEQINPKRLEADPTAMLCIDCAGRSER